MAAAATDSTGAEQLTSTDIEMALCYSVADSLCGAATGTGLLSDACAQAAVAYKHDAFAERLQHHVAAVERLKHALKRADQALAEKLALVAPKAIRFIDSIGSARRPQYTAPAHPTARGVLSDPLRGTVKSRHAGLMAALWTVRHGYEHFGRQACLIPDSSTYEAIAVSLGTHLGNPLQTVAAELRSAISVALADHHAEGHAAKRQRLDR